MQQYALLIGNSDGIGLATTKRLLERGWDVTGISRSKSSIGKKGYHHIVADVGRSNYPVLLKKHVSKNTVDLCIYFVGIGELLDPLNMNDEPTIIDVNLTGMVRTASLVIPRMVNAGRGHFIGISSLADELLSAEAPSYHASKAGFSNYLEGLALALRPRGVQVTNVRFGFVDTKMAKGDVKPFMMSVEKAVDHLETCISKKPVRYTAPTAVIPLIKIRKIMMRFGGR
ncbi:MAG: SDR family NAD(P)-dependent oxidoreductase [Spirochaetes bacterium]|nr:SDR family NAD(P)-dependent oxidoreductase [Spirochaetota bacterium]